MQKKFENVKKKVLLVRIFVNFAEKAWRWKDLRIKNLKMLRESVKIPGRADVWVRRSDNVNVLKIVSVPRGFKKV